MSLTRTLYLIVVIALIIMTILFFKNDMNFIGWATGFSAFVGILNYFSIIENGKESITQTKPRKRRRIVYYEQKEPDLSKISKHLKK